MNWLKCLGRWVLGWGITTNRKKEKEVCDGGVAGSSCCTNVEATLRGKSQELINLARYLEMGVRQTLCWVAGATATEGNNPKVKTEYDICEVAKAKEDQISLLVGDNRRLREELQKASSERSKDIELLGTSTSKIANAEQEKIYLLREQVKMLKKERHMDLKLLEGATHKINRLRQKMAELKEELRLLSPAKKKTKVNRPGTPAPRVPPTSTEKMPGTPAPSGPPSSAGTRPQGVRGGGINDGWAASSGKTPKAKRELNIWAAILEMEGNRSREGGAQSGVSRGATGLRVSDF